jgi:hypothetical protein
MRARHIPIYFLGVAVSSCVGLVLGGLAAILLAAVGLSITGHSDPIPVIDRAFQSRPMGGVAIAIIGIYVAAVAIAAWMGFRLTRRLIAYFYQHLSTESLDSYAERGGAMILPAAFGSLYVTWPFARLCVSRDLVELSVLRRSYSFPSDQLTRLRPHRILFGRGLRIEHRVSSYPSLLVFWSFDLARTFDALLRFGYVIDTNEG